MGGKQPALAQDTIPVHLIAIYSPPEVRLVYQAVLTIWKGDVWEASTITWTKDQGEEEQISESWRMQQYMYYLVSYIQLFFNPLLLQDVALISY